MTDTPRHLALPPLHRSILDWWAEAYDHVFIAFHPFFRVPGFKPSTAAYGPIHSDAAAFETLQELVENPITRPNEAPEDFEERIKAEGRAVSWADVQQEVGASDFNTFARTVWLWTLEADRSDCDPDIAGRLDRLADAGLYAPEEDTLPVIMEPMIRRYLDALGVDDVTIWSGDRMDWEQRPTEDFSEDAPAVRLPGTFVAAISCDDPRILIAWNPDGVEAFVCIPDEVRRKAPPERFFEGRYAGLDTYVDWLNPRDLFDRIPARPI